MSIISLNEICFSWGGPLLLDHISLTVDKGEKIGLVGRNGMGKSSLLGLLDGTLQIDDGEIKRSPHVVIKKLVQDVPSGTRGSVLDIIKESAVENEHMQEWEIEHRAERLLQELELTPESPFSKLSSGMKRRVLLAQALLHQPDVLLLDEPTNHLDISSITWLEKFIAGYKGAVVFVTHDRKFLQTVANRIVEIERGRLFDWTCNYNTFLERKEAYLASEERQAELFDKKLAEEEIWIRKGIKARRTRNEGRVKALFKMREERRQRKQSMGNVQFQLQNTDKSGQVVIQAKQVQFDIPDRTLINPFSTIINRGDKIGIIGQNGAGKSTLLKLLLKQLEPTTGSVKHGTNLNLIYFDQLREQLDETKTIIDNISDGTDSFTINGKSKNIYSYLQDFLFTPERSRHLVKYLSGGERNRLLLAKLFTKNSNLMVLDEPTNDLDTETLELLEELLVEYAGTIIVVSHDREFLNNVVTSTYYLPGDGDVKEFIGGYDDFERQRLNEVEELKTKQKRSSNTENNAVDKPVANSAKAVPPRKRLSYKEQKELENIPTLIEELENEQATLNNEMSDPEFFKRDNEIISQDMKRLADISEQLSHLYERWEELGE